MIKPGTLCITVDYCAADKDQIKYLGHLCTVTGPLNNRGYPVTWQRPNVPYVTAAAYTLRPLNDPDNAAGDPAYTKRPEGIPA